MTPARPVSPGIGTNSQRPPGSVSAPRPAGAPWSKVHCAAASSLGASNTGSGASAMLTSRPPAGASTTAAALICAATAAAAVSPTSAMLSAVTSRAAKARRSVAWRSCRRASISRALACAATPEVMSATSRKKVTANTFRGSAIWMVK